MAGVPFNPRDLVRAHGSRHIHEFNARDFSQRLADILTATLHAPVADDKSDDIALYFETMFGRRKAASVHPIFSYDCGNVECRPTLAEYFKFGGDDIYEDPWLVAEHKRVLAILQTGRTLADTRSRIPAHTSPAPPTIPTEVGISGDIEERISSMSDECAAIAEKTKESRKWYLHALVDRARILPIPTPAEISALSATLLPTDTCVICTDDFTSSTYAYKCSQCSVAFCGDCLYEMCVSALSETHIPATAFTCPQRCGSHIVLPLHPREMTPTEFDYTAIFANPEMRYVAAKVAPPTESLKRPRSPGGEPAKKRPRSV